MSARVDRLRPGVPALRPYVAVPSTRPPSITLIIPVRNDSARLARCLASVAVASRGARVETIVVDHGSSDDSAAVAIASGATVLRGTGRNVAALRNAGAAAATGDLLGFVDADNLLGSDWARSAVLAMTDGAVGAAGAPYHAPAEGTWVQRTYDLLRRHPSREESAEWFAAGNMVVRRDAFTALGGFDETLESCEDVDLCVRLRKAGWRLLATPGLHSVHLGDPPTLKRLFASELWRGRDNLRVSLRAPFSTRNLISTAVPVAQLVAPLLAGGALLAGGSLAGPVASLALAAAAAPTAARVAAMRRNAKLRGLTETLRCAGVAITYDVARALALLLRAQHHREVRSPRRRSA